MAIGCGATAVTVPPALIPVNAYRTRSGSAPVRLDRETACDTLQDPCRTSQSRWLPSADTSPGLRPGFDRAVATLVIDPHPVTGGEIHATGRNRRGPRGDGARTRRRGAG
ncbi:hypothetical protein GCM10011581_06270 [Saccharopolyspora subtropica]|uniref:Uncharacterized protein n=1 Tax=Saccharopolyspora thermophila TaxID=89367 RepID=A0A917N750_9PSEU|nr:hypothetical protein GCM10011581_06270 [Saccharopolyspora subtropica]